MTVAVVPELLEEYGRITRDALRAYLAPRIPSPYLYDLVGEYPARGGRMLRPSLLLASARAHGVPLEHAVHTAVALELVHNAFLIHDDVEDESLERRGQPTLPALHGIALSVNAGDAMAVMALRVLLDSRSILGSHLAGRIIEETERMMRESIEGQAIELGWRRDNVVELDDEDYFGMVLRKTCWYTTIYPARVGAVLGGREVQDLSSHVRYGFFLGTAFQIQDDILNLVGDHRAYGKELYGDLWEGKRTLILIELLRRANADDAHRVSGILGKSREARGAQDIEWLWQSIRRHDCIEYARQAAHAMVGAAIHESASVFGNLPSSRDTDFLHALPRWVIERA